MGNRQSGKEGQKITYRYMPKSVSEQGFQRTWSKATRHCRKTSVLRDPYQASQTAWPIPQSEVMFLPEYKVKHNRLESEYKIQCHINKGAYGEVLKVFKANEPTSIFAIKVLSKVQVIRNGAIRQCKEEASIQSAIGHYPFIVRVHAAWQSKTSLYLVMDYATHGDLHSLWLLEGAFSEVATRLYIAEIAMAMAFLHRAGIIYRDLKMENILLDNGGHILLSDFGLSKWLKQGLRTSSVCGTLMYMAPEVLNMVDYDHRVDWWSLGIIMFCLVTGKYPLSGSTNHIEMYNKVMSKDFKLPPFVSYPAQDIILQLLCKDPSARLSCLATLKRMQFFVGLSFEKVLSKQMPPTAYLKRKLPKTCQELTLNGVSTDVWKPRPISRELSFDNFDWIRETDL